MKKKHHRIENELRNVLLRFMNDTGFTANKIGNEVGCHPQTITNWVNGEKSMTINMWTKIHDFIESSDYSITINKTI